MRSLICIFSLLLHFNVLCFILQDSLYLSLNSLTASPPVTPVLMLLSTSQSPRGTVHSCLRTLQYLPSAAKKFQLPDVLGRPSLQDFCSPLCSVSLAPLLPLKPESIFSIQGAMPLPPGPNLHFIYIYILQVASETSPPLGSLS